MGESTQHKLSRIRPPRVQITYDVEIGGAIVKKEIPFVVGIMADLSGINHSKLPPLKERKFVEIDRDNFPKVMEASQPEVELKVFNWLDTGELSFLKAFRELHATGSEMSSRNAKSFVFHKAEDFVNEAVALLKDYSDDKAKDIDDLLQKIRNKADNSGELDEQGAEFLRKLNKLLKSFKFNLAKGGIALRDQFKEILDKVAQIPKNKMAGTYVPKELSEDLDAVEKKILKDAKNLPCKLKFTTMDDFSPLRILQQIPELEDSSNIKQYLSDLLSKLDGNAKLLGLVTEALSTLEKERGDGDYDETKVAEAVTNILNGFAGKPAAEEKPAAEGETPAEGEAQAETAAPAEEGPSPEEQFPYLKTVLDKFFDQYTNRMIVKEYTSNGIEQNHVIKMLIEFIADVNDLLVNQVNEVLHSPDLQELEASWRALHFLVKKSETGERLKLRLMNITKDELQKDLEKAVEFDQSNLFKKVYEEEYGTFGGHPFGMLIGDYAFSRSARDMSLLTMISNVASAAHAPFIASADPGLFDMGSFGELPEIRDLGGIFDSLEMVKWSSFRDSEDSRYVALTLPKMLMRLPYGPETLPVEGFDFKEKVDGKDHSKYLWANSCWALAQRITEAFARYSWCAAIRGVEGGGVVEDLPAHVFNTDSGDKALKCPTEVALTDRREKELSDLGFMALIHCKGKDFAAFFGGQTTQKPKKYDTPQANANARLSTVLPYILAASRFAHYLKVIVRDKVGSFMSAENVQVYLNRWIGAYVLGNDDAGQEIKAQYPLREARIDVSETPGKPGCYTAVVFLRPHFQLEELTTSIRLVAELPPPAA